MIVKEKSNTFVPPPAGQYRGVIVDVTPPPTRTTKFGTQEGFKLVVETDHTREDGSRSCVWSRFLTPSLHEKSNLRKVIKQILGRDLTPDERQGFDLERILGKSVIVMVNHEEVDGVVYANILAFSPDKNTPAIMPSGKYIRVKDRPPKDANYSRTGTSEPEENPLTGWQAMTVHVGVNKGSRLGELSQAQLQALHDRWIPTVGTNPSAEDLNLKKALEEAFDNIPY